ncbi:hypothetical protein LOK49_LG02G00315 [Camellia lanceoleosa]|uniref:Uncharacterized protein n=1 Tax=Camellia lanceoleosa TaxID=1840588 RepID=A0ACC0IME5_9ERIC|nr:hypothetical protein LOK49_LG02G00315 [Camellia lanceoleosa]
MKKIQNQKPDFKSTTTFNSTTGGGACASVCWGLAVGTRRGVVELYDLVDSAALFRSVSLYDWGYSMDDTGAVSCITCTLDNSAFAVGWKLRGLTVWSISGCRLMSTICQIGLSTASSPVVKANQDCKYEPMMGGTSLMHWDEYGYRLHAAEEHTDEFKILHLHLPVSCLSQMAASKMYLAVAGLSLLGNIVVVCYYIDSSNTYELLFYPQYHLNQSSLLCRKPLFAKPVVMDVFQGYLLVTYRPFDVHIFHVKFSCELAPSSTLDLQLRRSFSPADKIEEALLLAQLSAQKTHFSHCLEGSYLHMIDSCSMVNVCYQENVIHLAVIGMAGISYLAWGLGLFEECFQQRWYWTGSLYTYKPPLKFLKVIAELEDPTVSQYCALCLFFLISALCLLQAELDESLYELAGELEYLQRKRYGSACLGNFASGIKLIGQKVIEVHIV